MIKIFKKNQASLPELIKILRAGKIVALPTETAYGLATDATKRDSVNELASSKGRTDHKPIAVMVGDVRLATRFFYLAGNNKKLASKFWPGPLTILLRPKKKLPKKIIGPGNLVGVRVPGDKWLRELLVKLEVPLTATSANLAGKPTPYSSSDVRKFMKQAKLNYLVDAGRLPRRPASTVVRWQQGKLKVLRPGAIAVSKINHVLK